MTKKQAARAGQAKSRKSSKTAPRVQSPSQLGAAARVARQPKINRGLEEYRSSIEQLESSSAKLQSLNKQLTAVNSQLQEALERERSVAGDLKNILDGSDVAILFLDRDFNVRYFTPGAAPL